MQNAQAFAVKGAFAAAPAARMAFAEDLAVRPTGRMPMARAGGAMSPAVEARAIAMERQVRLNEIFIHPGRRIINPEIFTSRPDPPLRRTELTVPAAPTATPADTDVFESGDGSTRYVLPRSPWRSTGSGSSRNRVLRSRTVTERPHLS
jgi:hypothetical protein